MSEQLNRNSQENKKSEIEQNEMPGVFNGPVVPAIIRLAVPMLLGMLVQILYNIVDTAFITRIDLQDPSYIGGSGIVFPVIFFAMAVASGLAIGMSSLVARAIGEKNTAILNKTAESGLFMAAIVSVFFVTLFYVFTDQIIGLLGAQGDYFVHAKEYLVYIIPAGAVVFIMNVFVGILQGEGLMKYVMIGMLIGTTFNIILDPVFIYLLKMGVSGAALATTIAQAISCAYLFIIFIRGKSSIKIEFHVKNINTKVMKQILEIGIPQTLGMMLMSISFLLFNRIIIQIDEYALSAFTLTGRFDQIVMMPLFALSGAIVTLIGQNAGRGLLQRARLIWHNSIKIAILAVLVLATLMIIAAPGVYSQFTNVPEVLEYSVLQTRLIEYTFLLAGIGILAGSVFQGFGFSIHAMVIMILRILGFSLPSMLLFVFVFKLGIYGVWFGMMAGSLFGAILGFFWVESTFKKLTRGELKIRTTAIA